MGTDTTYAGQLAERLEDYRNLGRKEATKHLPATSATYPDTHEVELRSKAEALISREQATFDGIVADASRSTLDARSKVVELRADIANALADDTILTRVEAELAGDRTALVDVTTARIRAEVAWRGFRATNGITDLATYPESKIWHWAIIVALSFVETLVNAFFYRNDTGLLGGFFVALAVAVVNMGTSAGLGTLFRRKNLAEPSQRYFGWAALIIFIPFTLFCNSLFAAFRSAFEATADAGDPAQLRDAFQTAWGQAGGVFVGRIHFGDLSSFLLFMTGLILSIIAFWKGYTSDDPYPGHSSRDRALKAAREAEVRLQERVNQRLKDFLVAHRTHVQGLSGATGTTITMLSHRTSALGHARLMLANNTGAVERDYHLVLDAYRQANLAIRGTEPPAYFADKPDVAGRISTGAAEPVEQDLKATLELLEQLQKQHREDLNGKLNQLQSQTADILKTTYERFLESVDRDAQAAVQKDIQTLRAAA